MKLTTNLVLFTRMGFRNILKYKRRSIQVGLIVMIGAFVITAMAGFSSGLMEKMMKDLLDSIAHGKIYYRGYYQKQKISPLKFTIPGYKKLIIEINSVDKSVLMSPSISAGVVVGHNNHSFNMACQGFNPYSGKNNDILFPAYKVYRNSVLYGRFFKDNTDQGILISSYVATVLNCNLNDKVILFASDSYGSFNAVELKVIGIFRTGYKDKDENICITDLNSIQNLVGLEKKATELSLVFDDISKADTFDTKITAILNYYNLEYFSWKKLIGLLLWVIDTGNTFVYIIYLIFVVIAAVWIMNMVLITIFDRARDIGTLRSIGFTKNNVTMMIITEVLLLGVIGAFIGTLIGGGLIYYFSIYGIPVFDSARDLMSGYNMANRIYTGFKPSYLIVPFIISSLIPVIASIYPLLIMRKMQIRETLG